MITASTASTGSMAYVAIERMTGELNGRQGSSTFSHRATMMKDDAPSAGELSVMVVPNSGTAELIGLSGSLIIHIDEVAGSSPALPTIVFSKAQRRKLSSYKSSISAPRFRLV
jgi:Protein of unknown function (DUF3224)